MADQTIDTLQRVPLLANLDFYDVKKLAEAMKSRTFRAGKAAVEEGQGGAGFFIVLAGTATVSVAGEEVGRIGPGDYFGEVALLSGEGLRTATVNPESDLVCLGMASWEFKAFLGEHPDISWTILQTMAARLPQS
jgi:CRP-like cAMP-binding protein